MKPGKFAKLKKNGYKFCRSLQGILYPENHDINNEQQELPNFMYEGWNFNSGTYLFTTDTK